METRELRAIVNKAGGSAGKESLNYKMTIPSAWAKELGITKEDRALTVSYDKEKKEINIKKA